MSKDSVKQMFGKMEKNEELQKKYAALMQAHQKESEKAMAEKLIEFGKTSGFAFSKEDLLAARAEVIDKFNSNKELSDGDLASVAGGGDQKAFVITASIITGGLACMAISADAENKARGLCAEFLSITATAGC